MRIRDKQRSKVYTWERTYIDIDNTYRILDRVTLVGFINMVCRELAVSLPHIRNQGSVSAGRTKLGLSLPYPFAWTKGIVLHEIAHWLVLIGSEESHGAEFMQRYITLLNTYLKWDKLTMIESAKLLGIRVGT